jgi:hypothetical protein
MTGKLAGKTANEIHNGAAGAKTVFARPNGVF